MAAVLHSNQGDTINGFNAEGADKIYVWTGTFPASATIAVDYGDGIDFEATGTRGLFLVGAGAETSTLGDLFQLENLTIAIGTLENEALSDEHIIAKAYPAVSGRTKCSDRVKSAA